MGRTTRFYSALSDEWDDEAKRYRELIARINSLSPDSPKKTEKAIEEINRLFAQAESVLRLIWLEIEPQISNEDSIVLEEVSKHVSRILHRKHGRWVLAAPSKPEA